jgi:5-deoxy-glucuronate isomerase
MSKIFGYPNFDKSGEQVLTTYDGEYSAMLMDVRVYRMRAGSSRTFQYHGEELAALLLSGGVTFFFAGKSRRARRQDVFTEGPWCVHAASGETVVVEAETNAEILVQRTKNEKAFPAELYGPDDAPWNYSGRGQFGGVAQRRVNTLFDHDNAPLSNMVLGEVLNDRGHWSGYPPHRHPQPETYYFKFDRPEGFGASFVGERVFKSVDGSFAAIPGGEWHPQAVAPGFQMYTCWMIRHLDGQPWLQTDRCEDERYAWLREARF